MTTIRCPKCGKDVPQRNFCGFCGSLLTTPQGESDSQTAPQTTSAEGAEDVTPDLVSNDILSQLDEIASVNMGPREREPSETRQKEIPNDLMQRCKNGAGSDQTTGWL